MSVVFDIQTNVFKKNTKKILSSLVTIQHLSNNF